MLKIKTIFMLLWFLRTMVIMIQTLSVLLKNPSSNSSLQHLSNMEEKTKGTL